MTTLYGLKKSKNRGSMHIVTRSRFRKTPKIDPRALSRSNETQALSHNKRECVVFSRSRENKMQSAPLLFLEDLFYVKFKAKSHILVSCLHCLLLTFSKGANCANMLADDPMDLVGGCCAKTRPGRHQDPAGNRQDPFPPSKAIKIKQ